MANSYRKTSFSYLVANLGETEFNFVTADGATARFGFKTVERAKELLWDAELDRIEIRRNGATLAILMN